MGLVSSPLGKGLYEKYGFTAVYWFRPAFVDYDDKGVFVEKTGNWPLMVKRDLFDKMQEQHMGVRSAVREGWPSQ